MKDSEQNRARVIYLSILGRDPNEREMDLAQNLFKQKKVAMQGDRALVWILLNTPEFLFKD